MNLLLDTHFLLWILTDSHRLDPYGWLDGYRPWGISPVSLLEIQYLAEVGRLEVENPGFTETLSSDPRFVVDEVPLMSLVLNALGLTWTRDPFDRLLAAHSLARRTPLATVDQVLCSHHRWLPSELR